MNTLGKMRLAQVFLHCIENVMLASSDSIVPLFILYGCSVVQDIFEFSSIFFLKIESTAKSLKNKYMHRMQITLHLLWDLSSN